MSVWCDLNVGFEANNEEHADDLVEAAIGSICEGHGRGEEHECRNGFFASYVVSDEE